MTGRIEARLAELGIELPEPAAPAANYVPFTVLGDLVFIAGQLPVWNGEQRFLGQLGRDLGVEEGREAARLCALNNIAQLKAACDGDLDRARRCGRVGGFVNCVPAFTDQALVLNGASDLLGEVFGEAGRHARYAVGAPSLPFGCAVEVESIWQIG